MKRKDCVAMILAGGQGSRLGSLTKAIAKPVVPFGGKYKIIDFALSNCINSGIDTVGVLTQYQPHELSRYIGSGQPWDMDRYNGGIYILPPYMKGKSGEWYKGTANAIYQNIAFIESFGPEDVLVLSGDHIYIMDYRPMIEAHESKGADATIAVITVPCEEASRFGIMAVDEDGRVSSFAEKPKKPASNLASMGVYVFNWGMLKKYLLLDEQTEKSSNDFGKNIIPMMLRDGMKLFAHSFHSYWKDVGTIESLWQANMDLLAKPLPLDMYADNRRIYCRNPVKPPHFVASGAKISNSLVTEGCEIYGEVEKSVVFTGVAVGRGSRITNSVI
ncbi:MAG: glucose-1-phosphate adenylyltransferase, partial [Clostridiales bacterium]|nr:glucose-1-phosphate adenylyltransferase [Clostridiales bacterium]